MKVSTENDNNFGYEKISILIDNMPLNYIQKLYTTNPELGDNPFIMTIKSRLYVSFNSNIRNLKKKCILFIFFITKMSVEAAT